MRPYHETSADDIAAWLAEQMSASYRARQIRHWIFHRRAATFAEMSDLPADLRTKLAEEFSLWSTRIHTHRTSPDGTEKLLLALHDGHNIECVLLRAPD